MPLLLDEERSRGFPSACDAPDGAPVPSDGDEERWLQEWQRNEIRWLAGRTEELERQLWRRTMMLGCILAGVTGLAAGIGVFSALLPEHRAAEMILPLPPSPATASAVLERQQGEGTPAPPAAPASSPDLPAAVPSPADLPSAGPGQAAFRASLRDTLTSIKEQLSQAADPTRPGGKPLPATAGSRSVVLSDREPAGLLPAKLTAAVPAPPAPEPLSPSGQTGSGAASAGSDPGSLEPGLPGGDGSITVTEHVRLRATPDNDGKVLSIVEPGEAVQATSRRFGRWLEVREQSGLTGWIHSRFLSRAEASR